ncbi:MAG TPA: Dna2/Cas4 domain-containing protein [Methanocorpusculum sp.]|nr:Dna2/Cas4 domain-containing protein [Methanocorpusculum sp.]HJK00601.1 Dna2/Cas4 domain-containing protein [Methanocorpusculum sp.]HJK03885.1 Dna2/Cas4 domain-containing protein [Methanocorpusculum sp.]HJK04604.1 Dna2/Cas4 domain-containing protein [Methanocorpusculum sp.]HJK05845.1 Dna2/Cas4 domain-containing protein [Methanocorpusculum sp.]
MTPRTIPVHDLVRCSICPLQVYLARSDPEEFQEPVNYSIAKQISLHFGDELKPDEIWDELETVLSVAGAEEYEQTLAMIDACQKTVWRPAVDTDVFVSSQKYGISGKVDRLFDDGFAIVRSSKAPSSGIFAADRLRLTAYWLCLYEEHKRSFDCSVEYLGSGTVRNLASPTPADRRAFLAALHSAESVFQGEVPRPRQGHHCLSCIFHERCDTVLRPKSLFERLNLVR